MSGVHGFLGRRKKKSPTTKVERRPDLFGGIFTVQNDPNKKPDKEEQRKVVGVLERLRHYGVDTMVESNVEYALRAPSSNGDPDEAFRLLMLLQETYEGIVKPYNPQMKLLGAVNREYVTCFLDSLLFAMFVRLDSFEAMLYDSFSDIPRRKLAGLLRLWANMLRTGRLITTDVTAHLQSALAECGWADAAALKQQDPSEAFTFITGQLELPLLTLKMDLYHTGKEEPQDDHKFVNERLLEVAILEEPPEGRSVITLEDCLEHYFNNRIEVKRHLENRRRNTLNSKSMLSDAGAKVESGPATHIEVAEVAGWPESPAVESPAVETPATPSTSKNPIERLRPTGGRRREDSIFSQRHIELMGIDPEQVRSAVASGAVDAKERKMSMRTEVLMPAWQFFKLVPWYTDHMPTSDAQVAAHFSQTRPVLGICLKRYSYTMEGQARRRNDYVDIPLEIGLPKFVSDENMEEGGPLFGNFRLMLQSVVCHRGVSVHSGHYITLCRGTAANDAHHQAERRYSSDSDDLDDPWMRFDDVAEERVSYVDIDEALRQETPYLLFYQVQPIGEDGHPIHQLPSYEEATSRSQSDAASLEKPYVNEPLGLESTLGQGAYNIEPSELLSSQHKPDTADVITGHQHTDPVAATSLDGPRGRSSASILDRSRRSIVDRDGNFPGISSTGSTGASVSVPTTPSEEKSGGFLSVRMGSRRDSRVSKSSNTSRSRPSSAGADEQGNLGSSRFSLSKSRLAQRMSKNDVHSFQPSDAAVAEPTEHKDANINGTDSAMSSVAALATDAGDMATEGATAPEPQPGVATRKETPAMAQEKKRSRGHRHHEDRDCIIM